MKWIKATDVKPREGWHNAKYGGDECVIDVNNGEIVITFPNGIIETTPRLDSLEWLDESASLPSSSVRGEEELKHVLKLAYIKLSSLLRKTEEYPNEETLSLIEKALDGNISLPVTGESEAIGERKFTLKEVVEVYEDNSGDCKCDHCSKIEKQYFLDKFNIDI